MQEVVKLQFHLENLLPVPAAAISLHWCSLLSSRRFPSLPNFVPLGSLLLPTFAYHVPASIPVLCLFRTNSLPVANPVASLTLFLLYRSQCS